jgi:hypothetical protein
MDALGNKLMRLRYELQQAYGAWMQTSEGRTKSVVAPVPVDTSGCRDAAKIKWFEYLAAKERLVLAFAEQSAMTC